MQTMQIRPVNRPQLPITKLVQSLPVELQIQIWSYLGPFIHYLNNRINLIYDTPPNQTPRILAKYLWIDAFNTNFNSNDINITKLLPIDELPTVAEGLCNLKSRSLYQQLSIDRPDLLDLTNFISFYKSVSISTLSNSPAPYQITFDNSNKGFHSIYRLQDSTKTSLIHVAMANAWIDLLDPFLLTDKVVLGFVALVFGHVKLLKVLVKDFDVGPARYRIGRNGGGGGGGGAARDQEQKSALSIATSGMNVESAFEMVKYLCEPQFGQWDCEDVVNAMDNAVESGNLSALKHLYNYANGKPVRGCSYNSFLKAVGNCDIDMIKWVHQFWGCESYGRRLGEYTTAMEKGYLHGNGSISTSASPRYQTIRFLCDRVGINANDDDAIIPLATDCDIESVSYILTRRSTPFQDPEMESAAQHGAIPFIRHIREDRLYITSLNVAKFYLNHVGICVLDLLPVIPTQVAADVDVLYLIHSHAIKNDVVFLDKNVLRKVASLGSVSSVKYLLRHMYQDHHYHQNTRQHQHQQQQLPRDALVAAAKNGNLPVLKLLAPYYSDADISEALSSSAVRGHAHVVRFLVDYQLQKRGSLRGFSFFQKGIGMGICAGGHVDDGAGGRKNLILKKKWSLRTWFAGRGRLLK
ncbi:hypothetical protein HDU76_001471 [Blyttiomyces sp. JEL0837]|nr:hypothetical protein HDU76_001471 [Blyttiomyces sp. JEL0837]